VQNPQRYGGAHSA